MPAANVPDLRARLDTFARARLKPADFEPTLHFEEELYLGDITPELFRTLCLLEPFGVGNPEPIFTSRAVHLIAPPRILKEKHVKLKLRAAQPPDDSRELSSTAILTTPRCHPDAATIRRSEMAAAVAERAEGRQESFRSKVSYDALGWHMAERLAQTPLLAGDKIDIAFSIGQNDHPEYGGLELSLRDFRAS